MNFDFLKNVQVEVPVEVIKEQVEKNPTGMKLRVFANGGVYPGAELVFALNLEYTKLGAETVGNGLDVFLSTEWAGFPKDAPQTYLFVSAVDRSNTKVDLFTRTTYKEDGTPLKSVMTQGGGTFGKELVKLLNIAYGVVLDGQEYIDLEIDTTIQIPSPTGVHYIPKRVLRGKREGSIEAIRRDGAIVNPLVPVIVEYIVKEEVEISTNVDPTIIKEPADTVFQVPQTPEQSYHVESRRQPESIGLNAGIPKMPNLPNL